MKLLIAATLLLATISNAQARNDYDYPKMIEEADTLRTAATNKDDHKIAKAVRAIIRSMPDENVKFMGIDLKNWSLKFGTATYLDGSMYEITVTPFWPKVKDYAHVFHAKGDFQSGIGYIKGSHHITHENAVWTKTRSLVKVPEVATKVIVFGSGTIDTADVKEEAKRCNKLKSDWPKIIQAGRKMDNQTLLALTEDYYCPDILKQYAKHLYREVTVDAAYAHDATPITAVNYGNKADENGSSENNGSDGPNDNHEDEADNWILQSLSRSDL